MSDVKISELPAATTISSSDTVPIVQGGTTKKGTFSMLNIVSVKDGTDQTKVLAIDVSGVSTATTRTMTVPDKNFTPADTGSANTFTGVQTMTSPALTTPAITTSATITNSALATTTAVGATLQNTTTSTNGAKDQYSPAIQLSGRVFSSTDHPHDYRVYVKTVSGGGSFSRYTLEFRVDSGSWGEIFTVDYLGAVTCGAVTTGGSISFPGDSGIVATNRSRLQSFSDGAWRTSNNASNGAATIVGLGQIVTAKTSAYPVVALDSNTFFTNTGAGSEVDFTLPTAAANLQYTFYVDVAQTLKVIAGASTTIRIGASVSGSAGNISNATIGGCVTLQAISTTQWVAVSHEGTWTVT